MDEKRSTLSHFSGLIRIAVAVLIILLLTFLFVRWANNRRSSQDAAQKAAGTSKTQKTDTSNSKASDDNDSDENETSSDLGDTDGSAPVSIGTDTSEPEQDTSIPSGFADSVPKTGIEVNVATILTLMTIVYLALYNTHTSQSIRASRK